MPYYEEFKQHTTASSLTRPCDVLLRLHPPHARSKLASAQGTSHQKQGTLFSYLFLARARPRNVSPKSITRIYSITTRAPLLEARNSSPQNSRFLGYADC